MIDSGFHKFIANREGIFDIEFDAVTRLRPRVDLIDIRPSQKKILKELTRKSQEYEGEYK
jgi:hypothetical protein